MTVSPEEIRQQHAENKRRIEQHVEDIIQRLSLQPQESLVHNVEAYRDGIRVQIPLGNNVTVYVYALPWARGWSIFTTPLSEEVYAHTWREVPLKWAGFQMPVYTPRDMPGPWNCTPWQVAAAFEYVVRRVQTFEKRRRAQLRRKGWAY